jgi:hypothetical protein
MVIWRILEQYSTEFSRIHDMRQTLMVPQSPNTPPASQCSGWPIANSGVSALPRCPTSVVTRYPLCLRVPGSAVTPCPCCCFPPRPTCGRWLYHPRRRPPLKLVSALRGVPAAVICRVPPQVHSQRLRARARGGSSHRSTVMALAGIPTEACGAGRCWNWVPSGFSCRSCARYTPRLPWLCLPMCAAIATGAAVAGDFLDG